MFGSLVPFLKNHSCKEWFFFDRDANHCFTAWWFLNGLLIFFSLHPEYFSFADFYNQKRFLQLSSIGSCVPLILFSPQFRKELIALVSFGFRKKFYKIAFSVFVIFGALSILLSDYPLNGAQEMLNFFALAVYFYSLAAMINIGYFGFKLFLCICFIVFFLYLFKFLVVFIFALLSGGLIQGSVLVSGAVNVNFIAQPLGLVVPVLGLLSIFYWRIFLGKLCFFLLAVSMLMMFVIDNRGVPTALVLLSLAYLGYYRNRHATLLLASVAGSITVALGVYLLAVNFGNVYGVDSQINYMFNSAGRFDLWRETIALWMSSPIFGAGPYSYPFESAVVRFSHPHNFYVQFLGEWGIICFIVVSGLFLVMCKNIMSLLAKDNNAVPLRFAFLALIEGILHTGLSGVVIMPLSQTIFVICAAICFVDYRRWVSNNTADFLSPKDSKWAYLMVVVLAAFFIFVILNSPWLNGNCVVNSGPRFWVDGGVLDCDHPRVI